ncbi:bifunctional diaminohydroxyphosphoribosylaminopyrimidine deaminase/5-amino-6-(5-phosphoribosylamino)uracil reductase RibD [Helicobacter apodemus]|uniref:Riboflavin biosynthesis protein RibD n=1 Tax=Helicobacter apodemus TaxID=135569 RepID=A0A4U8UGE4_9HELI|nr:bifunctional diaminohydroxyphosphoribosylaminopyrimidine deaminase/5-amino-6-(5-phosphoribosylamino)uracil reductase RibD [Helicobacter apodemus]TLE16837.1 bifunctional diaminohydroxyphosphoribosylaminopyrimidine deaminase/5-amino-6-(5-phosphoribosylamino)uracil reductase RibD [Helicobacter apodemus]
MVDSFYLDLAIKKAWDYQCQTLPNPAVGAVILDKFGAILSIQAHKVAGEPHAEVLALQESYYRLSGDSSIFNLFQSQEIHQFLLENAKDYFKDITLYVTLEPCIHRGKTPSCAELLKLLGIKKIIIGTQDCNKEAKGGANALKSCGVQVVKAWEEKELLRAYEYSKALLIPFSSLQSKGSFILFKYASRLDGSIDGGQISSKAAQSFMHNLRTRVDTLLISGKSVRLDNPILDCRYATLKDKRPPCVTILTHLRDFPKKAPLFSVPKREVKILHKIEKFEGFVMCEGGADLFKTLIPQIDMVLFFLNPSMQSDFQLHMQLQANFRILYSQQIGDDLILWLQPFRD